MPFPFAWSNIQQFCNKHTRTLDPSMAALHISPIGSAAMLRPLLVVSGPARIASFHRGRSLPHLPPLSWDPRHPQPRLRFQHWSVLKVEPEPPPNEAQLTWYIKTVGKLPNTGFRKLISFIKSKQIKSFADWLRWLCITEKMYSG